MSGSRLGWLVIDSAEPRRLAEFWRQVLDYAVLDESPDDVTIAAKDGAAPRLLFLRVPEGKAVKNRLHIDLTPDDQAAEVERIIGLGARQTHIGQTGTESWVVLADPEGNEFCVLPPTET